MSYLVLARKYRPRKFSELVGQAHVVTALTNALSMQRLHHAYLFTGTRGVGKTTVSRILAKSLNCLGVAGNGGITASPCGVCLACRDIDDGRFADYTELDAASNRGVEEIQTLLEQSAYKPVSGRFKVFMIDEVHMLSGHAFNAMLKTLEEPPEYLKFVLATTDPQKVPATVLSRCLQFSLRPIDPVTVAAHLSRVLTEENVKSEPQALRLLARAARGSMRDALSLADQAVAFGNGAIEEAGVRQMLGSAERSMVFELIGALAQADGRRVLEAVDTLRREGQSAGSMLEEMGLVLQRMTVAQVLGGAAGELAADTDDPEAGAVLELAQSMAPDETQLLYSICLHGRAELGLAPDEYAALSMVLLRLLAFKAPASNGQQVPAESARSQPKAEQVGHDTRAMLGIKVRQETDPRSGPALVAAPVAPSEVSGLIAVPVLAAQMGGQRTEPLKPAGASMCAVPLPEDPAGDGDFWHALVQQLVSHELVAAMTRELALGAQLVARDQGHWMLRVERESLNQVASRDRLKGALRELGHEVDLSVEVGPVRDSPARRNAHAASLRQKAVEAAVLGDPFVQSMMRDFGAKIVPGSIQST
jgi:DNA polymerase-3 subunit gamma/tau